MTFDENVANVVSCNVDCIRNAGDAQNALRMDVSQSSRTIYTSVNITYLRRAWEHTLACIQSCTTGVLNFFDFGTSLADYGTHAGIWNHELNCHRSTAGHRGDIEGLVVDSTNNESKRL